MRNRCMLGKAMNKEFETSVLEAVKKQASLEEIVGILRDWRDRGLTSEIASKSLELIRNEADEEFEDRVLEIMDVVSGFCRPELRVWNSS